MRILRRVLLGSILGVTLALSPVLGAQGQESSGPDTAAVAVNTRDDSTLFRVSFQIIRTGADTVDNINLALAWASCEGCMTIAASFQVVLVTGDPSVVTPENYAIAVNFECTDCQTLASAYQWVESTGGTVHFTSAGSQALAEIRAALRDLMQSAETMTLEEIQAELDALALQVAEVLANELVATGAPIRIRVQEEDLDTGQESGEPTQAPTPIETATQPPAETDSPTPPATPAETASPTASPTATP
jgi:putative peptide zinc metalloprotease protein